MSPLKRMVAYGGIDIVLFPLNLSLAALLVAANVHYQLATLAGFGLQFTIAFFLNRSFTFHKPEIQTPTGLMRAYLVGGISVMIALGVTTLCVENYQINPILARCIAAVPTWVVSYALDAWFTFKSQPFS